MNVILKSGHIIKNVECQDATKNVIGLWVWSTKQAGDQLLTFRNATIRSSEIAAIEDANNSINIKDSDLPWGGKSNG